MTTYFDFNNENCIMTTLKSHDVYFIVYIKLCQKGTMSDHHSVPHVQVTNN